MPTTSMVLFGDGHGNFPRNLILNAGNKTNRVAAVDVNADGWADIVLMNAGSNDFDVFLNDKTGSFQVPYAFGVGILKSYSVFCKLVVSCSWVPLKAESQSGTLIVRS